MKPVGLVAALVTAFATVCASAAFAGDGKKQNGSTPAFRDFTSICSVAGYVNYGFCGGDSSKFTNVSGRINAMQTKSGVWNLGFSFAGLQPGATYKLWGNQSGATPTRGGIDDFFPIGTVVGAFDGSARFSYRTSTPTGLGFDLNLLVDGWEYRGTTIVTSYWSSQTLHLSADGTIYVPSS